MSSLNRRRFIGQSSLATLAPFPEFFSHPLLASDTAKDGRILVVIQLSGGNDGLNTVVPFADDIYAKNRRELRIKADKVIKVNDQVGLHPTMRAAADMLEDGKLSIVQGVGYPNPNRSHEVSTSIWQTARLDPLDHQSHGWLGRAMDESIHDADGSPQMILLGDESPPVALRSRRSASVAMSHLDDLKLASNARLSVTNVPYESTDLVKFARESAFKAQLTANLVSQSALGNNSVTAKYPQTALSGRLRSIAQLIKYSFSTPIYYAIQAGYDTHSAQLPTHARLLSELTGALKAFQDDLQASGLADRVLTFCFSEFGRRVEENASLGTDHGSAGPVLITGAKVQAGILGRTPDLHDLEGGDVKMSVDFREVYSSILEDWLGLDSQSTIGRFARFPIFH